MAKNEKKETTETPAPAPVKKTAPIQKRANETEAEMAFRIKSGNGHTDEYEDRFGKKFPK
jgi:hypothetical protein